MDITILGAGNAGWHLAIGFREAGHTIRQIMSRTPVRAEQLAVRVGAQAITRTEDITPGASVYLLAVPDSSIEVVSRQLSQHLPSDALVVHCSGASPASILLPWFKRHGVFWPPQSLSREQGHNWEGAPICISGSDERVFTVLEKLGDSLGAVVHRISEQQRQVLHLAAVFVNNFTNRCLALGHELCSEAGLDMRILHPIIRQTFEGAFGADPSALQTGPASRRDTVTIERHLAWLDNHHPEWKEVYRVLSDSIIAAKNN